MPDPFDESLATRFAELQGRGLRRRLPRVSDREGVRYRLGDRLVVGLCSNDYLGLAEHPTLARPAERSRGAAASRLVCGDLEEHRRLEAILAEHVGLPDAVVFPSGFQLNVGVLPAVLDASDTAYSDALNHASLIDGLRLAAARREILAHRSAPSALPVSHPGLHWWVSESVFSMDGDRIDVDAARKHLDRGGCLYLDEAHGYGLFADGQPLCRAEGLAPTLLVCTLGKALGCSGAFVAGSTLACEWIRTRARSFVFSTGASPQLSARVEAAIELVAGPEGDVRRQRLWDNAALLGSLLGEPKPPSPIFPVFVGDNTTSLEISAELVEAGWHVQPIRPPTVPRGTARLRVTVSAAHTREQLEAFGTALREVFARHDLRPSIRRGLSSPTRPRVVGASS